MWSNPGPIHASATKPDEAISTEGPVTIEKNRSC